MKFNIKLQLSVPELILIAVTMLWGLTFIIIHYAVSFSGPFFFVGLRFSVAALVLMVATGFSFVRSSAIEWLAGSTIGLAIALGYGLQTWGMQSISGSQSAFITAMYVPLVPLLQWLCLKKRPSLICCIGVLLAFIGLLLLSGGQGIGHLSRGEIITLFSSVAIAAEIILISAFVPQVDAKKVTVIQLVMAALFSFLMMFPHGESLPELQPAIWYTAGVLGLASAAIQMTMNWAQRSVSPTRATIIYAGEPVWAGVFGWIVGEYLSILALSGAALIVAGVLVSELRLSKAKTSATEH